MQTLVLNASYEPLRVVSWERAMYYLFTEKADIVSTYADKIRSTSQTFYRPKVIKLKKYVKVATSLTTLRYGRKNVLKRDEMICQYCGIKCNHKNATLDHIIPKSRGGKNTWTNVVTSCYRCNSYKGDRTPREARMELTRPAKRPSIRKILEKFDF